MKLKYQLWCESDVACAQDPSVPVRFTCEVPDPVDRYFNTDRPMANISLFAKLEVRSCLHSDAIVITTDGRTDKLDKRSKKPSVSDQYFYALHTY